MTPNASVERRDRFRALHRDGLFVMPNAWDIGSARLLAGLGLAVVGFLLLPLLTRLSAANAGLQQTPRSSSY